jgi:hypothetical protein
MCKELTRNFRAAQRDVEVVIEDDFGCKKFLYVPAHSDVSEHAKQFIAKHKEHCQAVKANLAQHGLKHEPESQPHEHSVRRGKQR